MNFRIVFFTFLLLLAFSCSREQYSLVSGNYVYHICRHRDSIYFSTLANGIFCFHPDHPESVRRISGRGITPFRSFIFLHDTIVASSYQDGLYQVENDSMVPVVSAPYPGWSIKLDEENNIWVAGIRGIRHEIQGKFNVFSTRSDVHDIAFYQGRIAVADGKGISLYDKNTGHLEHEWRRGVACWTVKSYDSLLIGGGQNLCLIINKDTCREYRVGPDNNALWTTERDSLGNVYCGTQMGLYRIDIAKNKVRCIGYSGVCIKSLCIDSKKMLWVGRFSKY
jgi:ligand-binding sensor domain-containing protein